VRLSDGSGRRSAFSVARAGEGRGEGRRERRDERAEEMAKKARQGCVGRFESRGEDATGTHPRPTTSTVLPRTSRELVSATGSALLLATEASVGAPRTRVERVHTPRRLVRREGTRDASCRLAACRDTSRSPPDAGVVHARAAV
jgi:hypothetical protein